MAILHVPDFLILPFGHAVKSDLDKILLSAVSADGLYFSTDVPVIFIKKSDHKPMCLGTADLLNVSRQYLVRLVEAGELEALKVGSHRRLRVAEIVAFKAARDAKRASALDRLTGLSEEAGGYAIDTNRR